MAQVWWAEGRVVQDEAGTVHGVHIAKEFVSQSNEFGFYFMRDGGPLSGQSRGVL